MGAYKSKPITDKHSLCGTAEYLTYAASSMQGWRMQQEDAHNCLPDFDSERLASLFAVYDGHGGSEVARYCAARLPEFLKELPAYKELNPSKALRQLFLDFDASLATPETRASLQDMVKRDSDDTDKEDQKSQPGSTDDETEPDETGELTALQAEAEQSLESVLERYGGEKSLPSSIKTLLEARRERSQGTTEDAPSTSKHNCKDNVDGVVAESTNEEPQKSSERTRKSDRVEVKQTSEAESEEMNNAEPEGVEETKKKRTENGDDNAEDDSSDESVSLKDLEDGEDSEDEEEDDDEDSDSDKEDDDDDEEEDDDDDENQLPLGIPDQDDGEPGVDSGTTACVAMVLPMEDGLVRLFVANAGDSRAVLCRGGAAVDLSVDHKPEDEDEKSRIIAAGGTVTRDGRVNGGLNLSRALGDHSYKQVKELSLSEQMITPLPDVNQFDLIPGADEFMVLACDGVWNSMTSQEVVTFVYDRLHPNSDGPGTDDSKRAKKVPNDPAKLQQICEEIFDHCLAPSTEGDGTGCDNMTCIIICFDDLPKLSSKWKALQCSNQEVTDPIDRKRAHKVSNDGDAVPTPKRTKEDSQNHTPVDSQLTVSNGKNI